MTREDAERHDEPWWSEVCHMRPRTAARYLGLSQSTLAKLRMAQNRHQGPSFSKVAGVVVYRKDDLDEWLERHQAVDEASASRHTE